MILDPFFTLRCSTAEWRINTNPISHTHAPKFEDGSEEESLKQERFVRRVAWTMARNLPKPKEKDKTTFFSLSEVWSLPAPSSTKPEERKFVVDSRGSLHKLSRKDLYSAELDTLRASRTPAKVITANGEVQTNEEATVYVYDLVLFVILKDTLAVLSWAILCEDQGYSHDWASGQKTLCNNAENPMQHRKLCIDLSPMIIDRFSASTSLASVTQDTEESASSPSTMRRRRTLGPVLGGPVSRFQEMNGGL